jgi:hypothetical protein
LPLFCFSFASYPSHLRLISFSFLSYLSLSSSRWPLICLTLLIRFLFAFLPCFSYALHLLLNYYLWCFTYPSHFFFICFPPAFYLLRVSLSFLALLLHIFISYPSHLLLMSFSFLSNLPLNRSRWPLVCFSLLICCLSGCCFALHLIFNRYSCCFILLMSFSFASYLLHITTPPQHTTTALNARCHHAFRRLRSRSMGNRRCATSQLLNFYCIAKHKQ